MSEQDDEPLDVLLREFFRDQLDVVRGRAEEHFRQHMRAASTTAWRRRVWLVGAFVSGLAASVAVLCAGPLFRHFERAPQLVRQDPPGPGPLAAAATLISPTFEKTVQSRTTDEGIVMLGDTPVRVVHRQSVERTRWFDGQDNVSAEEETPQDDVTLIKLTTY